MKKLIAFAIGTVFLGLAAAVVIVMYFNSQLPKMISVQDYQPLLVSEVFDRDGAKIGEFAREKRTLAPFDKIPKIVVDAFLAAEDSSFYQHSGINYFAIGRAFLANLKAGEKVQGASTITQQVARSLLLQDNEKTYARKVKEILLAYKMEANLSKQDILYLYLNQIYLGQRAYGVAVASEVYFNTPLEKITLPQAAMLAGLPKAPSEYSPLHNPSRAKERQRYVLARMADEKMVSKDEANKAGNEPLLVYETKDYWEKAPFFLETVRQMLITRLGEEKVMDGGIRIFTSLDLKRQQSAQESVKMGLRELDKRQGYRGPLQKIDSPEDMATFLLKERNKLLEAQLPYRILQPDGKIADWGPLNLTGFVHGPDGKPKTPPVPMPVLPDYVKTGTIMQGVVTRVDDDWGLVYVRFAEGKALMDVDSMKWARKPDPTVDARYAKEITKPSEVLAKGDVIQIKVQDSKFGSMRISEKINAEKKKNKTFRLPNDFPNFKEFAQVDLEQEPETQAALLSLDQQTQDVIALVGGYQFSSKNQLNRALQTVRQTGSSFKPFVYASALDKGFNPASPILDAPIVFEEETEAEGSDDADVIKKKWKPTNGHKFQGDILFRNALIESLNVPSVKIIEKLGVSWAADYARRLGIFSPLNMDFTLALGSSSVSLYEMTKAYSEIGRMGRRVRPIIVHKVTDKNGEQLIEKISLDERYEKELKQLEDIYEARRLQFLAWDANHSDTGDKAPTATPTARPTPLAPSPGADGDTAQLPTPTTNPAKEPPLFFKDPDQLMKPQTAYVLTSLLQGVVEEQGGTGVRAKALGRPTAGKTGTTQSYYDAWFMGYTADIATGVWVGYDTERSLGRGEVGGRAALPIWVEYMKDAHQDLPVRSFSVPEGITFASIDNETGRLASAGSKDIVRQAFIDGTEPKEVQGDTSSPTSTETQDFYKEDLSQ